MVKALFLTVFSISPSQSTSWSSQFSPLICREAPYLLSHIRATLSPHQNIFLLKMGKSLSQFRLNYLAVTDNPKSLQLKITKAYFFLMLHGLCGSLGGKVAQISKEKYRTPSNNW